MTGLSIQTHTLGVTYGSRYSTKIALTDATLDLSPNTICGVVGHAGTGKSTLLSVLAGFQRPTHGQVKIHGEDPFDSSRLAPRIHLVRGPEDLVREKRTLDSVRLMAQLRPSFDSHYALALMDSFGIDARKKMMRLTLKQRFTASLLLGLASRAPVTLFDEVYRGLDTSTGDLFYTELQRDYAAHPRTVVLAGALDNRAEQLCTSITLLHKNRILLSEDIGTLRERASTFVGSRTAVNEITERIPQEAIMARQHKGDSYSVTVLGSISVETSIRAKRIGLTRTAVPLSRIITRLTDQPTPTNQRTHQAKTRGEKP
ncbi:ATP-binding cassette domain-containing protein [Lysinibacter sp. HNR]|uniref:ATP-binding cassette domain-containing protein n=1 Tax=Lysinibacter sp. HNR TaxID=3031408 RepID=UPI002434D575|nr:ATP-binding cassette domain-containing protein [Lysinibacter sp. HNR]WGD36921.1 ATP-binding cassette domain-containing protein [Lysinibacter sp. HNR]